MKIDLIRSGTSMGRKKRSPGLRSFVLTILPLALAHQVTAQSTGAGETVHLVLRPESRVWIEGDSNLHAWSCVAAGVAAELTLARTAVDLTSTRVESGALSVPVLGIECGNGRMNENLRKALKAADHPQIRFQVTDASVRDTGTRDFLDVVASGDLSVAGATRPLEFSVSGSDTGDGAIRVVGQTQILMTDFAVEPPRALLGLLRTSDEVMILFDLLFGHVDLETQLNGN